MEGSIRPNRSDVHLSEEEAAKVEEATRDYFDGVAPKRHTKPQRSDYAETYTDVFTDEQDKCKETPEFAEFRRLENDSQVKKKKLQSYLSYYGFHCYLRRKPLKPCSFVAETCA